MAGTIITKKGMILIAKLLASNQELVFTRAAVGTGSAPHGWDPAGMIGLNQYKMDGKISSCHSENEEATVVFQISSTDVESGFVITEAGIFAEDPDEGEILYAYLDLSDDPQYVYAKNSVVQKFAEIEFKTVVGAIENITVITSPDALVTKEVFEKEIDALNNPEFEDYSAEGAEAPDARTAIEEIKSKKSIFGIMSNIKAALKGLVTLGEMKELLVNNGLCNIPGQYFLDAAFGKNLQDQVTDVNNNFNISINGKSLIDTILPKLDDIGKTCTGRFQNPTDFTPKLDGYSYTFIAQRGHANVIYLLCHPVYTGKAEIYEYIINEQLWEYRGNLITSENLEPIHVTSITSIADPQNISFNTLKYARIGNLIVGWIGGLRVLNKGSFIINNGDLPKPLTQVHVAVMASGTDIYIGNMYLDVNTKKLSIRGVTANPTGNMGYASFCYVAR